MPVTASLVGMSEKRLSQAWDRTTRTRCRRDVAILGVWALATFVVLTRLSALRACRRMRACGEEASPLREVAWLVAQGQQQQQQQQRAKRNGTRRRRLGPRGDIRGAESAAAIERLARALWTLRRIDGETGRSRFASSYSSYQELVDLHADDARELAKCSTLHAASPLFVAYHRLLLRRLEASLRSVDSTARMLAWTPAPADDALFDGGALDPAVAAVVGGVPGDARRAYAVADGRFALWPVERRDGPDAPDIPKFVVRYRAFCGNASSSNFSAAWAAAAAAPSLADFLDRAYDLHATWHRRLGGAVRCDRAAAPGDFENERTSVNDPAFFFVHAAFDALFDDLQRHHPRNANLSLQLWTDLNRRLAPCLRLNRFGPAHPFRPFFLDRDRFLALFPWPDDDDDAGDPS